MCEPWLFMLAHAGFYVQAHLPPHKLASILRPRAERPPPATVPAVVHHGIVYTKAAMNTIAAADVHGPLYSAQLYSVETDPKLDFTSQEVCSPHF